MVINGDLMVWDLMGFNHYKWWFNDDLMGYNHLDE